MDSDKLIPNPRFPTAAVKALPGNDKAAAPPSLVDRFRALLKQREEEGRDGDDSEEMVQLYELVLDELTFNSKPIITDLTIIAGELRAYGEGVADAICARIVEAPVEHKLPSLYLLDSIVKNIGREYARYFSSRLPEVFCLAYKQVHPSQYPSMRHLFGTWSSVFPRSVLGKIEAQLQFSSQISSQPPSLPALKESDSPRPAHGIHVNPKYLRQLEQSTSDNNAQHVRGASPTLRSFSQKPAVGYDEYDSDHADVSSTQVGAQRLNALGSMGNTSFALGANKFHQSSSSRLARHLSPSTVGAERPLISEVDEFAAGNSPQRFVDGASPSHPVFEYGSVRSVGRDDEINEWRRKPYPDDSHKRFEAPIAYSHSNGHGRQGPRALIDAYGEDERNKIPSNKSLLVDRLDSDGLGNKVAPMSWQNTEEEEFDWEDMSPTLADRSGGNNFLTARVPPFRGPRDRPGFVTRDVSRLEADGRTSQSDQAQLSLMEDSSNIMEDAVPILSSARGSTGKMPGFETERSQITGSHYPQEPWKLPHHFPHPTDRTREMSSPFSRSAASSSGNESLAPLVENLPESDSQLLRPPTQQLRTSSSAVPSSMGPWPIVNVHKSHPPPTHPIFPPQKQSRTQYDPRIQSNPAANQGSQKSSFMSDQQLNSLETKEPSFMKPSFFAGMNHQNQPQLNPFAPQFHPPNGTRENFSSPLPPHPLLPQFDLGYGMPRHSMGMRMVPSNPMHPVRHPLPFNYQNSFHSQSGMRPPLPSAPHPASQVIPMHQNTGPIASNQTPFSGLIGSLMAQGLISLTNEPPLQDSLGLDFNNPDLLKVRHESAISALYADLPRQCTTCGLRFKNQEEHSSHMDWHVTKNRTSKNRKQKPSRKWFVSASMWLSGAEALGADAVPGFLPAESVVEKKDDEEMAVPADEDQNACALCGEPFDDFYSDETEEWMYKGAVYLNAPAGLIEGMDRSLLGPIVHAKCRSESSTVPPDD
ncbi:hypothetical protein M5689_002509 [Euphorbia peplus]|nr:hypothetical protein M5689_002509 [Euphorbia peplus]